MSAKENNIEVILEVFGAIERRDAQRVSPAASTPRWWASIAFARESSSVHRCSISIPQRLPPSCPGHRVKSQPRRHRDTG
jgi:hypothetical protein